MMQRTEKPIKNRQAYFDVEDSLCSKFWIGPDVELERAALHLQQRCGVDVALSLVLARQGVSPEGVEAWLEPKLRDLLPDPRQLKDIDIAAARLIHAVNHKEKVAVFADYDVDGAASGALLVQWFRALGGEPGIYVPDRIQEGYGPNAKAMRMLSEEHDLIVLVDCGTLGHEAIAAAEADILVLDHHQGGSSLPEAVAVVNPNRQDEEGGLGHLAASGVVFMVLVEAGRQLREAGSKPPDLLAMLDLVALATIADVVPLIGINRAFVRQGLRVMGGGRRPGIACLAQAAKISGPIDAQSIAFSLAPRLNAGGRIGRADLALRLLSSASSEEANAISDRLSELNFQRREMESVVREQAFAQMEARMAAEEHPSFVWAAGESWHPGVLGIVAARMKEAVGLPAIALGLEGDEGKGSGRSIPGIDLGAAIAQLAEEGFLLKGGGHAMAAGLTLHGDKLVPAMERLGRLIARQSSQLQRRSSLEIDGVLMPGAIHRDMLEKLEQAGPFGSGQPQPRFLMPDQRIASVHRFAERHLKLRLAGGGPEVILFGADDTPLGRALEKAGPSRVHLVGQPELNRWNGRIIPRFRLEDAAYA